MQTSDATRREIADLTSAVFAREGGRSSIPAPAVIEPMAAAYWIPPSRG